MKKSRIIATALWLSLLSWGANKPALAQNNLCYSSATGWYFIAEVERDGRCVINDYFMIVSDLTNDECLGPMPQKVYPAGRFTPDDKNLLLPLALSLPLPEE